jgi:uncharacterized membrane protein YedE/YeeE
MDSAAAVAWGGAAIGFVFGFVGLRIGFCLTSALRSFWTGGERRGLALFAIALAVAIVGSQSLDALGVVSLDRSIYRQPTLAWPVTAVGGLLFGYGMMLANGCGSRALMLLAGGNLRSFVVLVSLGIAAYATLTGVLAPVRVAVIAATAGPAPSAPEGLLRWLVTGVAVAALLAFAASTGSLRANLAPALGAAVIGLLVPAGWLITGVLGADEFDPTPLASVTFVAPIGEALQYLMLASGLRLGFGTATVAGVLVGAAVGALFMGKPELRGFDSPQQMVRAMAGGVLMGVGGALALGCSIGQGLTGLSTLTPGSALAAGGIVIGAYIALRGPLRAAPAQVASTAAGRGRR